MFFQLPSTMKVNLVAKIMQSAYLCVIVHVKHKKLLFLAVLTWFLILGQIQDGDHCWWRHRPPVAPPPIKYTSSCWEDQRLSSEGKIASKYCNISKSLGRRPITTWICVYVWGLKYFLVKEKEFFCWWKVSKFLSADLFYHARKVDVSVFQVKN